MINAACLDRGWIHDMNRLMQIQDRMLQVRENEAGLSLYQQEEIMARLMHRYDAVRQRTEFDYAEAQLLEGLPD